MLDIKLITVILSRITLRWNKHCVPRIFWILALRRRTLMVWIGMVVNLSLSLKTLWSQNNLKSIFWSNAYMLHDLINHQISRTFYPGTGKMYFQTNPTIDIECRHPYLEIFLPFFIGHSHVYLVNSFSNFTLIASPFIEHSFDSVK